MLYEGFDESRVIYRLLKNSPEENNWAVLPFYDMQIAFFYLIAAEEEGMTSVRIAQSWVKEWGADYESLYSAAMRNTPRLFPSELRPIEEVISDLLQGELPGSADVIMEMVKKENKYPIYVLSNLAQVYGATAMIYEGLLQQIGETLDCDYYLLPASVHEVLIVPYNKDFSKKYMLAMVHEMNLTQLPEEDVLSDAVYYYSREEHRLFL
ncbi:DUF5688 family protein [Anaerolentibacter hominis]|uniref:DUF5688 family protein n=1 Tax=Anaerolentibacter hominis TaxID=3079009 RepID=UPI0031B85213